MAHKKNSLKEAYKANLRLKEETVLSKISKKALIVESALTDPETIKEIASDVSGLEKMALIAESICPGFKEVVLEHTAKMVEATTVTKNSKTFQESYNVLATISSYLKGQELLEYVGMVDWTSKDRTGTEGGFKQILEACSVGSVLTENHGREFGLVAKDLAKLNETQVKTFIAHIPVIKPMITRGTALALGELNEEVKKNSNNSGLVNEGQILLEAADLGALATSLKKIKTTMAAFEGFEKSKKGMEVFADKFEKAANQPGFLASLNPAGVRDAASNMKAGLTGQSHDQENLIAQASLVVGMFKHLGKKWPNIKELLSKTISDIGSDSATAEQKKRLMDIIIQQIGDEGGGAGGESGFLGGIVKFFQSKVGGKIMFPVEINPRTIAEDMVEIISEPVKPPKLKMSTPQERNAMTADDHARNIDLERGPVTENVLFESIESLSRLDGILTKASNAFSTSEIPGSADSAEPTQKFNSTQQGNQTKTPFEIAKERPTQANKEHDIFVLITLIASMQNEAKKNEFTTALKTIITNLLTDLKAEDIDTNIQVSMTRISGLSKKVSLIVRQEAAASQVK